MPFWKKKEKPPPPQPMAYLDIMRAPEDRFFIQLRTDVGPPTQVPDSDTVGQLNGQGATTGKDTGVPGAPGLPPSESHGHGHASNFSPMSATRNPPVYSTTIHRKRFKKDAGALYHGMPASGTMLAEIAGQKITFSGNVHNVIKRRKFLFRKSVLGHRNCFRFQGTEIYMFQKSKKAENALMLWPLRKSPAQVAPLAVFEMLPGDRFRLGEIRLYQPQSDIDTMLASMNDNATQSVINNSSLQPTQLLDTALIAWFTYRSFRTNGSLVDSLEFKDQTI